MAHHEGWDKRPKKQKLEKLILHAEPQTDTSHVAAANEVGEHPKASDVAGQVAPKMSEEARRSNAITWGVALVTVPLAWILGKVVGNAEARVVVCSCLLGIALLVRGHFPGVFNKKPNSWYVVAVMILVASTVPWMRVKKILTIWLPTPHEVSTVPSGHKTVSDIGIFMDCTTEEFPLRIPRGTTAHVLRVHPFNAKHNNTIGVAPLLYVDAPADRERVWPSDVEAPPVPKFIPGGPLTKTALALNCTVRKYGVETADHISIPIEFGNDKYNVPIEPLNSSGTYDRFSFDVINACYVIIPPGTMYGDELPPILSNFPRTALARPLGENYKKQVPVTVSIRDHQMPVIFLLATYRHWTDLPPC